MSASSNLPTDCSLVVLGSRRALEIGDGFVKSEPQNLPDHRARGEGEGVDSQDEMWQLKLVTG